jgi:hypothetical protein
MHNARITLRTYINAHTYAGIVTVPVRAQDGAPPPDAPVPDAPEGPVPDVPSPAPPTGPNCSYTGYFAITPNLWQCGPYRKYLSFVYPRCDAVRVSLLTKRQLESKPLRSVWSMRGSIADGVETGTTIKSYMRSNCGTRYLQDVAGTNMRVGAFPSDWVVRPLSDSSIDCFDEVSLFSPTAGKYLSMQGACEGFTLTEDAAADGASFKLIKLTL